MRDRLTECMTNTAESLTQTSQRDRRPWMSPYDGEDPFPWSAVGEWSSPPVFLDACRYADTFDHVSDVLKSVRTKVVANKGIYSFLVRWVPSPTPVKQGVVAGHFHLVPSPL